MSEHTNHVLRDGWTALDYLKNGKQLIMNEENWAPLGGDVTQNRHCVITALYGGLFNHSDSGLEFSRAQILLAVAIPEESGSVFVSEYNDTHTHSEILDLYDRAIAMAKEGL